METKTLADLLCKITDIKVNNSMNPFVMSQPYLRKAELISECIVASATLSRNINDRNVWLRRRINQQRSNSSAYSSTFHGNKDEILSFNCENNTNLTWEKIFDALIAFKIRKITYFP